MSVFSTRETVSTSAWCLINAAKEGIVEDLDREKIRSGADDSSFSNGALHGLTMALGHIEELMRSISVED